MAAIIIPITIENGVVGYLTIEQGWEKDGVLSMTVTEQPMPTVARDGRLNGKDIVTVTLGTDAVEDLKEVLLWHSPIQL
jgi:hypothetical protein